MPVVLRLAEEDGVVPRVAGAAPPAPSGRSGTTSVRIARTFRGAQPARSGRCRACMPRSPMQPYAPFSAARRFQLIGFSGSRSLEWRKSERTSITRPNRRSADQARDLLAARDRRGAPTSTGRAGPVGRRSRG